MKGTILHFLHSINVGGLSMHFLSLLIFVVTANIDCLAIGLSYGLHSTFISTKNALIISIISTLGTFLSMWIGTLLMQYLPMYFANMIGAFILIIIGIVMIIKDDHHPNTVKVKVMNTKETLTLSSILAVNNIGLGIGGRITGIPILSTCLLTLIIAFTFIKVSQYFAKTYISQYFNQYTSLIAGLSLMILGLYEMVF